MCSLGLTLSCSPALSLTSQLLPHVAILACLSRAPSSATSACSAMGIAWGKSAELGLQLSLNCLL